VCPGADRDAFRHTTVSAKQAALTPPCAECGERWLAADATRWRAYLTIDDELAFYCPECAEREFGDSAEPA
jgi:hypothetical protein